MDFINVNEKFWSVVTFESRVVFKLRNVKLVLNRNRHLFYEDVANENIKWVYKCRRMNSNTKVLTLSETIIKHLCIIMWVIFLLSDA